MDDASPGTRLRAGAASLALLVVLAGCSAADSDPSGSPVTGDPVDRDRMAAVADDEQASAGEIVEAGRALDAASSGGTVLVAYTLDREESEGRSAAAWRLYDADGATLAEHTAGVTGEGSAAPQVLALADGYLVTDFDGPRWQVDADGTRTAVTDFPRPSRPRPGDVPLGDDSPRLYRPATRTVFPAAPTPGAGWHAWTAAADGTLWRQRAGGRSGAARFDLSRGGGPWQPIASYDPGPGRWVASLALVAVGDRVVAPVLRQRSRPDRALLEGLLVRSAAAPAERPWDLLAPPPGTGTAWWDVRVAPLDDATVLVGPVGATPWLVDVTTGEWRELAPPTDEEGWAYAAEDGRLYALHRDHADARLSEDRGATWTRLTH